MLRCRALLLLLHSLYPLTAFSQDPSYYESVRSLGRGGGNIAAFDSDEAIFLNPATIAEPDIDYQLRVGQIDGFIGQNALASVSGLSSISSGGVGGALKAIKDKTGQAQAFRVQMVGFAQRFGTWEFSPFMTNQTMLELENPYFPGSNWTIDTVAGFAMAYARTWKMFNFGLTLRPMQRIYMNGKLDFLDLMDFLQPNADTSQLVPMLTSGGVGLDFGITLAASPNLRFGFTAQNIGDTSFTGAPEGVIPPHKQKLNLGLLWRTALSKAFNLDYFFDLQDFANDSQRSALRMMSTGIEIGSSVISRDHDYGVTLGLKSGYFTAGFFVDLLLMRVDIVNFAYELGERLGQRMERQWAISNKISMTF